MARFDYDVVMIGAGFGGSVAALRAGEKGYRVGVMESRRSWQDEDIPKTNWNLPSFLWLPAAEMYGMQRLGDATTLPWNVGEDHDRFVRAADGWELVSRRWVNLFTRGDVINLP